MRAAIYTRISRETEGERSRSPEDQERDCRAEAERRGWEVVKVYTDRNLSAFQRAGNASRRRAYQEMRQDAAAGRFDVLLCYEVSRLGRNLFEGLKLAYEDLAPLGVDLVPVLDRDCDTTEPNGWRNLRRSFERAEEESERTSDRIRRRRRFDAEDGRPAPGGARPFGYGDPAKPRQSVEDLCRVHEPEATLIREAAGRFIAGDSLRSICRDWNDRGVRSPGGAKWHPTPLGRILRSERVAGKRRHRVTDRHTGRVVSERVVEAVWPAILEPEQWERIVAANGTSPRQRQPHLLTGIIKCACGNRMNSYKPGGTSGGGLRYRCVPRHGDAEGCGRISVKMDHVEREVVERLFAVLDDDALGRATGRTTADRAEADVQAEQRDARRRLDEIAADYGAGTLTREQFAAANGAARERVARLDRELARARQRAAASEGIPATVAELEEWWKVADLEAKREALRAFVELVTVHPATKGRVFDPKRVKVLWRV